MLPMRVELTISRLLSERLSHLGHGSLFSTIGMPSNERKPRAVGMPLSHVRNTASLQNGTHKTCLPKTDEVVQGSSTGSCIAAERPCDVASDIETTVSDR